MNENIETPQTAEISKPEIEKGDAFHNFKRLANISTWSSALSWVFLILGVLLLVFNGIGAYNNYAQYSTQPGATSAIIGSLMNSLVLTLVCLFFFVLCQAIAEWIYLWVDIEDNTRRAVEKE